MNRVHGLNFRDETLWRGRMLAFTYAIRGALTELGGWLAALVIAYQLDPFWPGHQLVLCVGLVMCVRMFSAHYDDWRRVKAVEKDIAAYIHEI
jgi:hypothetical protein